MTSISTIASHFIGETGRNNPLHPEDHIIPGSPNLSHAVAGRRVNASFVMLARNSDVDGAVRSVRALEDRFNNRYGYPYVFLNEVPFTEDFKR